MSDLNYNVNATVTGGEEVHDLADDLDDIKETPSVTVDATGLENAATASTELATGLEDAATNAGGAQTATQRLGDLWDTVGAKAIALGAAGGFALKTIKDRLDFIAETNAWDDEQVQAYKDAIDQVGAGLQAVNDKLTEAGELSLQSTTGLFGLGGGETLEVSAALGQMGITVDDVARAFEGGDEALHGLDNRVREASINATQHDQVMQVLNAEYANYQEAADGAAERALFFNESQRSANEALQDLLNKQDPFRSFTDAWDSLGRVIADGSIDTQAGANAINTLTDGLGLTTEQVLTLAQQRLDEQLAADAAAAKEAADGMAALNDAMGSVDWQQSEIEGATTAMSEFTAQQFAAQNQVQSQEEAFRRLRESADGVALTFDVTTEAGAAQQDALEGVAAVLDQQLAQAYDNANGNQQAFTASATTLATQTLTRLKDELGLSDEQVGALADTLGLLPEDIQTRYEMSGVAEAQLQVGLLQGAIDGLPPEVESAVVLAIAQGDYVGARDTIVQFYKDNPVPAPVEPTFDTTKVLGVEPLKIPFAPDTADVDTALSGITDVDHPTDVTLVAHTEDADAAIDTSTADRILDVLLALVNGVAFDAIIDNHTADRTQSVNLQTGSISLPTAASLAARIGTIRVPVQPYYVTRIEGSRPR